MLALLAYTVLLWVVMPALLLLLGRGIDRFVARPLAHGPVTVPSAGRSGVPRKLADTAVHVGD